MKKIILLAILASLSGCVVAPAQPGYYGPQPYYVQPAPVVVGPAFYVGGGCCWHGGYHGGGWRR